MPPTTHQQVTVNLNVNVDASGNINVFGQEAPSIINKIVASTKLPVQALYDASGVSNSGLLNSLFEFWEPSDALGTRRATLAVSEGRDFNKLKNKLVMDLQAVLMGEFDCSDAKPFKTNYTVEEYYKHPHFGRVALSSYAHYLFGHVAATAAITNDSAFMGAMMSTTNVTSSSPGTYNYASTANVSFDDVTSSTLDAKLALRLVNEITTKDDTAILAIVEQVLGQDASRAMDEDNNALAPGGIHPLKFIAGDKIYLNIRLRRPNVTISNGGLNAGAPDATQKFSDNADTDYTLEITLDDIPGAVIIPPELANFNLTELQNIYNNTKSLNLQQEGATVSISNIYNLSNISSTEELKAVRQFLLNNIFSLNNISTITSTASELNITVENVPSNLVVVNPLKIEGAYPINNISSTTGIYVYLDKIGHAISFTDGIDTILLQQTGNNVYTANGIEYSTGQSFTFGGKTFIIGSILVIPSIIPSITDYQLNITGNYLQYIRNVAGSVSELGVQVNGTGATVISEVPQSSNAMFLDISSYPSGTTFRLVDKNDTSIVVSNTLTYVPPSASDFTLSIIGTSLRYTRNTVSSLTSIGVQVNENGAPVVSEVAQNGNDAFLDISSYASGSTFRLIASNSGGTVVSNSVTYVPPSSSDFTLSIIGTSLRYTRNTVSSVSSIGVQVNGTGATVISEVPQGSNTAFLDISSYASGTTFRLVDNNVTSVIVSNSITYVPPSASDFTLSIIGTSLRYNRNTVSSISSVGVQVNGAGATVISEIPQGSNTAFLDISSYASGTTFRLVDNNVPAVIVSNIITYVPPSASDFTISIDGNFLVYTRNIISSVSSIGIQINGTGAPIKSEVPQNSNTEFLDISSYQSGTTFRLVDNNVPAVIVSNSITYIPGGTPIIGRWIDGIGTGSDIGNDIITDINGNVYVIGQATSNFPTSLMAVFDISKPSGANNAGYLIKYNSSLVPQWGRWIDGGGSEISYNITIDNSENIIISGTTNFTMLSPTVFDRTPLGGGSSVSSFVIKYNSSGTALWGRILDYAESKPDIITDSNRNIYIAGSTTFNFQSSLMSIFNNSKLYNDQQGYIIKYSENGTALWGTFINNNTISSNIIQISSIGIDTSNNVYVAGSTNFNLDPSLMSKFSTSKPVSTTFAGFILKYNSSGIALTGNWLDGAMNDYTVDIKLDSNNNIYVLGTGRGPLQASLSTLFYTTNTGTATTNSFIVKYNSSGTPLWGQWINSVSASRLAIDSIGNIYVSSILTGSLTQLSSISSIFNESRPTSSGFTGVVIKYNTSGIPRWGRWIDSVATDQALSIFADNTGSVYVTGYAANNLQSSLLPIFDVSKPGGINNNGGFVIKYSA